MIAKKVAHKYTFGFHDKEDIEQEAILIGMEALPRYREADGTLSSFLYVHITNRLKNFKRDNYYRPEYSCTHCGGNNPNECKHCERRNSKTSTKKQLMEPIDLEAVSPESISRSDPLLESISLREIFSIIDKELEVELRADYLRMKDGAYVPMHRRIKVEQRILEILKEYNYEI